MKGSRVMALLALAAPLACCAAAPQAGRWTGRAHLPGRDVGLVVDLARDASGAWVGSIVIPGFGVKGAALEHGAVKDDAVSFDVGNALGRPPDGPAAFVAHLDASGGLAGEMRQGGNSAPFELRRTGEAQVEMPRIAAPVPREIEGRWVGEYEFGGYPRHVTVDIANRDGVARAEFVVVGKQTTNLPIDFVGEEEGILRIECNAYRIAFEGRIRRDAGRIDGTFEQGAFDVPLVLRRAEKPT